MKGKLVVLGGGLTLLDQIKRRVGEKAELVEVWDQNFNKEEKIAHTVIIFAAPIGEGIYDAGELQLLLESFGPQEEKIVEQVFSQTGSGMNIGCIIWREVIGKRTVISRIELNEESEIPDDDRLWEKVREENIFREIEVRLYPNRLIAKDWLGYESFISNKELKDSHSMFYLQRPGYVI